MKVLLGVMVVIGVAFLAVYQSNKSFDPEQQHRDAVAAISPGMTWDQVIDVVKPPKKFRRFEKRSVTGLGGSIQTLEPGAEMKFDAEKFPGYLDDGRLADGFVFEYLFTADKWLSVHFDNTGTVTEVYEAPTVGSLLLNQ